MTAYLTARGSGRRRLAILAGVLAVLFATLPSTEAGGPPFSPQTVAYFPADDKLVVAVTLENAGGEEVVGRLRVELLAPNDKVVAGDEKAVRQKEATSVYRFELGAPRSKADSLTVRCRLNGRTFQAP